MSDAKVPLKTGKLLRETIYLIIKNPNGPNTDVGHMAPAGSRVEWYGATNEGHEASYGGRSLFWIDLPDFRSQIGAELGIDFEWEGNQ